MAEFPIRKNDEEGMESATDEWLGKEPMLLSDLLEEGSPNESQIKSMAAYLEVIFELNKRDRKASHMKYFYDFTKNIYKIANIAQNQETDAPKLPPRNTPPQQAANCWQIDDPQININELVIRPEVFNGYKPKPRQWLEDYEFAATANGWSDKAKAKFFATFLEKSARDWYFTLAMPKLPKSYNWPAIKESFMQHYLGRNLKEQLNEEWGRCFQMEYESVTTFVPRAVRLYKALQPWADESEIVNSVLGKMKSRYIEALAARRIIFIDELVRICQEIDVAIAKVKSAKIRESKMQNDNKNEKKNDNKNQHSNINEANKTSKNNNIIKDTSNDNNDNDRARNEFRCYNCGKLGHIAKVCRSAKQITSIGEASEPPQIISMVKTQAFKSLLYHNIVLNDVKINAMIDTGASCSVIDERVLIENNWSMNQCNSNLIGAGGEPLATVGVTTLKLEIATKSVRKMMNTQFVVVKNFAPKIVLGIEEIRRLKLVIKNSGIEFEKEKRGGVRLKEAVKLEAKCEQIVNAIAYTFDGTVAVWPTTINQSVLIANSICKVENNRLKAILLNLENKPLMLKENLQIGTYEHIMSDTIVHTINGVMQLENTSQCVRIGDNLSEDQCRELAEVMKSCIKAFSIKNELGLANNVEHDIELLDDAKPHAERLRRRPLSQVQETKRQVQELLAKKIIRPSKSPWASAYVLARKKNNEWRLCVDFRKLNKMTKKNVYPLPNIDETLDSLAGNKYYSQLDFASGYWQIPMSENAKEKTAFKTEDGLFEFERMPFGLTNAPASFQKLMNSLFTGLRGVHVQIYLDDVCIATTTWEEHLTLLKEVLSIVIKANLKLQSSKCVFGANEITFLGHKVSAAGIKKDPEKVQAITKMPRPADEKGVRRVIGMFSYYRKFIPNFATIAEPLTRLLRKNENFVWNDDQEYAWKSLIEAMEKTIVLAHYNYTDQVQLKTDASRSGIGAILMQKQKEEWQLIACVSRCLDKHEANYPVTELEGLAVVYAVSKLRHYLLGISFEILVDHCALCSLNEKAQNTPRLQRWAILLSEYNFKIVYRSGELHKDVDCLSRAPTNYPIDDSIESMYIMIPVDTEKWKSETERSILSDNQEINENDRSFELRDGLVYKDGKLFVPETLRNNILDEAHNSPTAAHGGQEATIKRLSAYWWPNMRTTIRNYVNKCSICQMRKHERNQPLGEMRSHLAFKPNEKIAIDYMGPITESSNGNKLIIVAVDVFSKFVELKAVADHSAGNFVSFLVEYCGRYGIPNCIITDNAKQFSNAIVRELQALFGFKHQFSVAYHSRGNANAERMIQTVQEKLSLIISSGVTSDWEIALPIIQLSINSTHHSVTKFTPAELQFGRNIMPASSLTDTPHTTYATSVKRSIEQMKHDAITNASNAQAAAKARFDNEHRQMQFEPGMKVLTKVSARRAKLEPRYKGPYEIIAVDNDIYTLKSQTGQIIHRHANYIKPFRDGQDVTDSDADDPSVAGIDVLVSEVPASGVGRNGSLCRHGDSGANK